MNSVDLSFETIWYISEWAVRIGALAIVPMRRSPEATRSWLLLIFFLPLPGLALFLAIGSPRFPRWRHRRFAKLRPIFNTVAERQKAFAPDLGTSQSIAAFAFSLGSMPATGGNRVELIDDYDAVIARLIGDIETARCSVSILVYIFADDAVGRSVADALGRAVERGVRVRVMFDPVGSGRWRRATLRMLHDRRIPTCEALPFHILHRRTRRDMRNHRKLFVIDGQVGYAGSQNIVAKDFRPGIVNRELVARVEGPVAASMELLAQADWHMETGEPVMIVPNSLRGSGNADFQLLPSGADYRLEGFETLLVWQLHRACEQVTITTPYFIPDTDVLNAMRSAVARGVTVHLIVSKVVDQRIVNLSQSSYYDELLKAGVRISMFRDYLLHAKNVSIDGDLAIIGSSNVDLRSFQLNQEVSLLVYDRASIDSVERVQRGYLDASEALDPITWRSRPFARRLLENIARLLNSLL